MGDRFDSGRLEAFSDGVFAIAITLLVLGISVPADAFDNLWKGIADQWPSYLAYATSFWTIGGLWLAHHGIFRRIRYADPMVLRTNLLLLMVVAFLPFPTKLVGEAITTSSAETPAVLFYGATLLVIEVIVTTMGRHVAARGDLLLDDVRRRDLLAVTARTAPTLPFIAAVLIFALLAPKLAAFGFLVISVLAVLRPAPSPARLRPDASTPRR